MVFIPILRDKNSRQKWFEGLYTEESFFVKFLYLSGCREFINFFYAVRNI